MCGISCLDLLPIVLLVFGRILMTFNKKAFVARNRRAAQIEILFADGTFHKFCGEVLNTN